jgi:hypothetical protein
MLTYADECNRRMLTHADVCNRSFKTKKDLQDEFQERGLVILEKIARPTVRL